MIKVYTGNFLQFMFLKSKERTKNNEFSDHTYNDMTDDNTTIWKNQLKKSIWKKENLKKNEF